MKKKVILSFVLFAAAGSALVFGAGTSPILSPKPPADPAAAPGAASAVAPAEIRGRAKETKARREPRLAAGKVLQVRGKILQVHPADAAKRRAEWIVLMVGGKRLSVVVSDGAKISDGKGAKLRPALLKAGETVSLSYRQRGATRTALRIKA